MLSQEFMTAATAIEYLDITRSAFEFFTKNDVLRKRSTAPQSKLEVLCKDVENVKEVLANSKNNRLPRGFVRTWA